MGLLRVEQEVIRALREQLGDAVTFAIYNSVLDGYYRVPAEEVDALLEARAWRVPARDRAVMSPSRWRRHARRIRLARELRHIPRAHPGDSPSAEWSRDAALAQALSRVSLEEYSSLRRWLQTFDRLSRRLGPWMSRADLVNHQLHFGQLDAEAPTRFAPENAMDPAEVTQYLSVGGFWGDNRYKYAYHARKAHGWTVHYLIYDLIPVLWRHLTEPTTKETFPLGLHWVLWGVDQIWTISDTTRQDLLRHIADNGYPPMADRWVTPVLLGADSAGEAPSAEVMQATLARYDLDPGQFVLMVGTLEPRKNHAFAYQLWREMHQRNPGEVLPLVFVGQSGWSMGSFVEMLLEDVGLPPGAIRVLSDVGDEALGALYEACRFTVYPSHYEGWGLPVVEALNHGKPCLCSDAPSIVEAAQGAADTLPLMDGEAWIARAMALMREDGALAEATARAEAFGGYRWEEFRANLVADFAAFGAPEV